jgi:hypothetical protein
MTCQTPGHLSQAVGAARNRQEPADRLVIPQDRTDTKRCCEFMGGHTGTASGGPEGKLSVRIGHGHARDLCQRSSMLGMAG